MIDNFEKLSLNSQEFLTSQLNDSEIPQSISTIPDIIKLDSLIINNFKSFGQQVYVGPFLGFTSIIGPNGSGKSNVLQAMMFAFCSQSIKQSYFDIRDFIWRDANSQQSYQQLSQINRKCWVQIKMKLRNNQYLILHRQLDPEANQKFLINYEVVSKKLYQQFLHRKGINPWTPNYAIWQGQIDRLILKQPNQLTAHFEQLSGSALFQKEYQELKNDLQEIRIKISNYTQKMTKLRGDRTNLKYIKQNTHEYQQAQKQYSSINRKLVLAKNYSKKLEIQDLQLYLRKKRNQQLELISEINIKKAQKQRQHYERIELHKRLDDIMTIITDKNIKMKSIDSNNIRIKIEENNEIKLKINKYQLNLKIYQNRYKNIQINLPKIPETKLTQQYYKLYKKWQNDHSSLNIQLNKRKNQLLYLEGLLQSKKVIIDEYNEKQIKNKQIKQQQFKTIQILNGNLNQLSICINKSKVDVSRMIEQKKKNQKKFINKKTKLSQINQHLESLEEILTENIENQKQKQIVKKLLIVEGFLGVLEQKVKPTHHKYELCFKILMNQIGRYLLCENQNSAKKIANKLRDMNQLKNLLILDNLKGKKVSSGSNLGNSGTWAIQIIDYDRSIINLDIFLEDYMNGKVICNNLHDAYILRQKNIRNMKQIYTLSGEILRNDGVITAIGEIDSVAKQYKYSSINTNSIHEQIKKITQQKITLSAEVNEFQSKINQVELIRRNLQIAKMEQKQNQLKQKLQVIKNTDNKEMKIPKAIINEIKDLQERKDKIIEYLKEIQNDISNTFEVTKFMKQNNINDLECFRNMTEFNNIDNFQNIIVRHSKMMKQLNELKQNIQNMNKNIFEEQKQFQRNEQILKNNFKPEEKQILQKQINQFHKEILSIRKKLSKINILKQNELNFKSELPQIEAKINLLKQKQQKQIQEQTQKLGIDRIHEINFNQLEQNLTVPLSRINQHKIEILINQLQNQLKIKQKDLDKYNTLHLFSNTENDEYKLQQQLKRMKQQVQQMIQKRKQISQRLELIKKDRRMLLINFIEKIKPILSQSYLILTQQKNSNLIGKIDIFMENQQQPFQYGLYFSPTPPTKRFIYDLEQLSGGEKSIASLALQYSIAVATKCPFLLLDQTDAFLDNTNVDKFAHLVQLTQKNSGIQFLLITHKKGLFVNCQSLVGVTKPKGSLSSQAYSLLLQENP